MFLYENEVHDIINILYICIIYLQAAQVSKLNAKDADEQTTQDLTEFVQSLLQKMVFKLIDRMIRLYIF